MCFNATVSFALGSALVAIGIVCVTIAHRVNKKWRALALIPLISGVQQLVEGLIWLQLDAGNGARAHFYSYFYLFFAYTWWPGFVPICVYLLELNAARKKLLRVFIITGLITSAAIYVPILIGKVTFSTVVEMSSVHYLIHVSTFTIWTYTLCYAATIILPLLLSSRMRVRIFGLIMTVCMLINAWLFMYAFTSVWCFFAGIGSAFILLLMYKLPTDNPVNIENHSQQH